MSQPTNVEELAQAFGPNDSVNEKLEQNGESVPSEKHNHDEKNHKKKLSKKQKIAILVVVWLVLVAGAVGLAFVLRPKVEVGTAEDEFTWQGGEAQELDVVDVDYYSYYDANDIEFEYPYLYKYDDATGQNSNPNYDVKFAWVPQIDGLKNLEVQNKINNRIMEVANEFAGTSNEPIYVRKGANLDNVLSLMFSKNVYNENNRRYEQYLDGVTFDLGTGDEIAFDDIFTKSANITAIVYKRFYNALSSKYSFDLKSKERAIGEAEAGQCVQFCEEGKSVADLKQEKAEIEEKLNNIEEIAQEETQKYLAGSEEFYLESAGPVLIYDGGKEKAEYYTPDDTKYFAYYKKYLTKESLYVDDKVGAENLFLSSNFGGEVNFAWVEENENYFVDYQINVTSGIDKERSLQYMKEIVDQILATRPSGKYMYIYLDGEVYKRGNVYNVANLNINTYTMDKSYYDSTFRKIIFDSKNQSATMSLNQAPVWGSYDEAQVEVKRNEDYDFNYAIIDEAGNVYNTAESLFEDGAEGKYIAVRNGYYENENAEPVNYIEFLKDYFYKNVGEYNSGNYVLKSFSDAQKEGHDFELDFSWGSIYIVLKNTGDRVWIELDKIPKIYIKEALR